MTDLWRRIAKARFVRADMHLSKFVSKADLAMGDLAAGGLKAPEQAAPNQQRSFRGIPIEVDRPKGHVMTGTSPEGKEWRRVYHVDYGFIPGTQGGDGEGLDVFLGGDEASSESYWILQRKADGTFDEYKVCLGFADGESAKAMYLVHVPKRFFGSMVSMSVEMMKALLGIEPVEEIAKAEALVKCLVESFSTAQLEKIDGTPEELARRFHETYERLAPSFGYETRPESAVAWEDVPEANRRLMIATVREVFAEKEPVGKPFASFANFDACVAEQKRNGHSEESARKICGSLQAAHEKNAALEKRVEGARLTNYVFAKEAPQMPGGELRYVLGIVLEPDVVDGQGDTYSADEIRKAAWNYLVHFRNIGLNHKGFVNGKAQVVESYIAPNDFDVEGSKIRKGTWLMGLHISDDELWSMVKDGSLSGLSIGGWSRKDPV